MNRGEVIVCALSGDFGKPRPAVIVQTDLVNETHSTFVICPITSFLMEVSLFRILIKANSTNGLICDSQIMVDKISTIKREKISKKIGILSEKEINLLNNALRFWLSLD